MNEPRERRGEISEALQRVGSSTKGDEPTLLPCSEERSWDVVERMLRDDEVSSYLDCFARQLDELVEARTPSETPGSPERGRLREALLEGRHERMAGTWVYYPWSRRLLRLLAAPEFRELRASRNQHKITAEEQAILATAEIGIVGLSVGHIIALTLALEGVGGVFHLADFDEIELSNLNRIPCGLEGLGQNKARVAARRLFEVDPYLDIRIFPAGVPAGREGDFLEGEGKLSLLVEECDDLATKIRLREEARALGIPVLCETNDRGLLDVERFDLEPERPILHGLLGGLDSGALTNLETREKVPFVLRFLGGAASISPRLGASLLEVNRTLAGWSQLASGTTLGGAVVCDAARRILLGSFRDSGRFRVDVEALVSDGAGTLREPIQPSLPSAEVERVPRIVDPPPGLDEVMESILAAAALAPSGGNVQPWRFCISGERSLDIHLSSSRSGGMLDFRRSASRLACGAAAENAILAGAKRGLVASTRFLEGEGDSGPLIRLDFAAGEPAHEALELANQIQDRATNRRSAQRRPLSEVHVEAITGVVARAGGNLSLVTEAASLEEVGELLADIDRFRFMSEPLHREMMSEVRWSTGQTSWARDGIEVASLEGDEADVAGLRLLAEWPIVAELSSLDAGEGLREPARRAVKSASAVGLIRYPERGSETYLRGGMAVERAWLMATKLGLSVQPMSVATFLFARLIRGRGEGLTSREIRSLTELHHEYMRIFGSQEGMTDLFIFRLMLAPAPSLRSLRLPLAALVDFE